MKEFREAMIIAVAIMLGILVVPYAAGLLGDAIDQQMMAYEMSARHATGSLKK